MSEEETKLAELIKNADSILIIQADNPDGDSLGSSIALEQIFTDMGKKAQMFCSIDIPGYLKYLSGWSRVVSELPRDFDLTIIVDTSSLSLLDKLSSLDSGIIKSKNACVVLDHHDVENSIDFASLVINRPVVATGELIYDLAKSLDWPLNDEANKMLAISILSDSLGLMSAGTSAKSIRVIADLVDSGVNLAELDSLRRETYRKSPELTKYKGQLLQRVENHLDNRLAMVVIPWEEIEKYSPAYNPSMLVIEDMRLIEGNCIAVALKLYSDHKITAKIRANYGSPIAGKLAEKFGGGGHKYAAGFKTSDFSSVDELKKQVIETVQTLLSEEGK